MRGNRFLLDTNAIVALLQGNQSLVHQLQNAEWVGISIISQLEFLVFPELTDADKAYFSRFLQQIDVIGLTPIQNTLITTVIDLRQTYRLKLPDAIIAATAIEYDATLITADKQLHKVEQIAISDLS